MRHDDGQHSNEDAAAEPVQSDERDEHGNGGGYRPGAEAEESAEDGHGVDDVGGAGSVGCEAASMVEKLVLEEGAWRESKEWFTRFVRRS